MNRDTPHGTKGRTLVRAMVATLLVASLFGVSALTASAAQDYPPGFDPEDLEGIGLGELELPTPLEACQEVLPDGIDVSGAVEEALADSDLPPELVAEIVEAASAGDLTCEELFAEEVT